MKRTEWVVVISAIMFILFLLGLAVGLLGFFPAYGAPVHRPRLAASG